MRSDPGKIRQILLNLPSNAVKFTPKGEVRLRLFAEGDDVVFQVADTGPGIAVADRERIFRPFEQADWGPTRVKGGAGLGLSVSLELARLLGGGIDLESEVGRGSTFTVRLPRVWRGAEA
ncbi:MAG TPA: ATP-binding protein [Longimicrobiales bacterium]